MDKMDIPQGTLDMLILTILSRGPLHGYGISQRLAELTSDGFQVNPGSLFPAIYKLEQDGKLRSEWGPSESRLSVRSAATRSPNIRCNCCTPRRRRTASQLCSGPPGE